MDLTRQHEFLSNVIDDYENCGSFLGQINPKLVQHVTETDERFEMIGVRSMLPLMAFDGQSAIWPGVAGIGKLIRLKQEQYLVDQLMMQASAMHCDMDSMVQYLRGFARENVLFITSPSMHTMLALNCPQCTMDDNNMFLLHRPVYPSHSPMLRDKLLVVELADNAIQMGKFEHGTKMMPLACEFAPKSNGLVDVPIYSLIGVERSRILRAICFSLR